MKLCWILIVLYYLSNHCMCHMGGHQLEELFGSGKNPDKVNKFYDYFLNLDRNNK